MIKKLIALTSILCCTLALPISSNAMELEKDNQKSELRLLDYTIDEIRQMKLGQYYQSFLPIFLGIILDNIDLTSFV